ncbi:hypothetical protein AAFF_G00094130 [Aldrovandia affinis]|uniref:Uncharacterized protein n=1 Tax=Aldrovandia affinis TaxID=143900 RepID=A0AAD7T2X7_9TELE|nr:hypothetical protein AAFF_G00094130 [Aldrovandia affinis]
MAPQATQDQAETARSPFGPLGQHWAGEARPRRSGDEQSFLRASEPRGKAAPEDPRHISIGGALLGNKCSSSITVACGLISAGHALLSPFYKIERRDVLNQPGNVRAGQALQKTTFRAMTATSELIAERRPPDSTLPDPPGLTDRHRGGTSHLFSGWGRVGPPGEKPAVPSGPSLLTSGSERT